MWEKVLLDNTSLLFGRATNENAQAQNFNEHLRIHSSIA
jgi:hypothetical protein